jgi:nitronate monooxygenase
VAPFEEQAGRPIPVIAAGGVFSGADIRFFLDLGAAGVQMGTRFVATVECDAAPEFKQAYVNAREEDLEIVKSPVGLPGRAIRNRFTAEMALGGLRPTACRFHCIQGCNHRESPFCITDALVRAKKGDVTDGLVFAGSNAWRVERVVRVAELMAELVAEHEATFAKPGLLAVG